MKKDKSNLDLIPLAEAVVCEDCKVISRAKHAQCPSCGGSALWILVSVIEGVAQREIDQTIERLWEQS
jgi:RNA polymerase subunit RPABC4/transcription elongation factor Spt4